MLVFLSDLHLADHTSGIRFLDARAFDHAFTQIGVHAQKAHAKSIEIIFLGDIFDLGRTTGWFETPVSERPWGLIPGLTAEERERRLARIEAHANTLLARLAEVNARIFAIFQDPTKFTRPVAEGGYGFPVEPKRTFIPGNHDRLCNQFESLRVTVASLLSVERASGAPFPALYANPEYRTFARHGHEWDAWNCERQQPPPVTDFGAADWDDYLAVPIGEVLATEIAAKLVPAVQRRLPAVLPDPHARQAIVNQLQLVDDVGPVASILLWLLDCVNAYTCAHLDDRVLREIQAGIDAVFRDFARLDFVRAWVRSHEATGPADAVRFLQELLLLAERLDEGLLPQLLPAAQALLAGRESDHFARRAAQDFDRTDRVPGLDEAYLYVLYGHTHVPEQVLIEVTSKRQEPRVYLNTGTWRPTHRPSLRQRGYFSWTGMTLTFLYHPEQDPGSPANRSGQGYPTFETWSGTLLEPPEGAEAAVPVA